VWELGPNLFTYTHPEVKKDYVSMNVVQPIGNGHVMKKKNLTFNIFEQLIHVVYKITKNSIFLFKKLKLAIVRCASMFQL
jgi:hypothetical protein